MPPLPWPSSKCVATLMQTALLSSATHAPIADLHACCSLQGSGVPEFMGEMQRHFTKVARLKVQASRSMSREFYAIGLGRKKRRA